MPNRLKIYLFIFCGLLFVFSFAIKTQAADVTFTTDTQLNFTSVSSTLYIQSGSACDNLIPSASTLIADVPSGSNFTLKTADYTVLGLTPSGGTVALVLDTGSFRTGYFSQWIASSSVAAATVNFTIGGVSANTHYTVQVDGVYLDEYLSSSAGLISFNYTGGFSSKTFTITRVTPSPGAGSSYIYNPTTSAMPITTTGQVTATAAAGGKTTIVSTESMTASIELPANAVSSDTVVKITPMANTAAEVAGAVAATPAGNIMVGGYLYNYSATVGTTEIITFNQPVTLTFAYTDSQISGLNESALEVYYWDTSTSEWVALTTSVNTQTNTITCTTSHFTYFAIMGEEETGAAITPAVTKPISQMTAAELQAEITRILTLITQLQSQLSELFGGGIISGVPDSFSFKATLKYKQSSIDVKYMQIVLNSDPTTRLAETGVGSLGKETNYFGDLTKTALIKFQERYASEILKPYGLTKGTGNVGVSTRAKLNKLLGK